MARIAIVLNASWNIYNFRLPLLKHLADSGHEVIAIAPEDEYTARIPYEFHPVKINSSSTNPLKHLGVFFQLTMLFRRIKPDIALLYTIQPNIYGNFAAKLTGVRTISNIAGLGSLFIQQRFATRVAKALYRIALKRPDKVFFQNDHDMDLFTSNDLVQKSVTERIPGSGVDLARFKPSDLPRTKNPFVFLMATRMLWDKGVREFVEAAQVVLQEHPDVQFKLMGQLGVDNPAAITRKEMQDLTSHEHIEYGGVSDSLEHEMSEVDCMVLPSYREGLPRVLLEAAAMAKPIITTRVPGCSDVVIDGETGFLCEAGNVEDLAQKMKAMLKLSKQELNQLGENGRRKVEKEFDQDIVIQRYMSVVNQINGSN